MTRDRRPATDYYRRQQTKAAHPADTRRDAVVSAPAGFTASIRYANRNNTVRGATLLQAATGAYRLEVAVRLLGGSTRATVYALPADGGGPEVIARDTWLSYVTDTAREAIDREITRNVLGAAHG